MSVHPAAPDDVAPRGRKVDLTEASQQWSRQEERCPNSFTQRPVHAPRSDRGGIDRHDVLIVPMNLRTKGGDDFQERLDIAYPGDVLQCDRLGCHNGGRDGGEGSILVAGWPDPPAQRVTAFDDVTGHNLLTVSRVLPGATSRNTFLWSRRRRRGPTYSLAPDNSNNRAGSDHARARLDIGCEPGLVSSASDWQWYSAMYYSYKPILYMCLNNLLKDDYMICGFSADSRNDVIELLTDTLTAHGLVHG